MAPRTLGPAPDGMAAAEYPAMLDMIVDGRLRPQHLVGSVISLDEAGQALMAMDQTTATRPGIVVAAV